MSSLESILVLSFGFPPMVSSRSIQVPRLLEGLGGSIVILCGDDLAEEHDTTIDGDLKFRPRHIIREPFVRSKNKERIDVVSRRLGLPSVSRVPDEYRGWVKRIQRRYLQWEAATGYKPQVLITFGMPMSDHLFGLAYKRRTHVPWIAHFSDPWVENSYHTDNPLMSWLNKRLERQVFETADTLVFTSPETIDLVMKKYPESWRRKVFDLPHICDRSLYDPSLRPPNEGYVIRFVGSLYGNRSPRELLVLLDRLAAERPQLFEGVSYEFVGSYPNRQDGPDSILRDCPRIREHVRFVGRVSHAESVRLMQTAHCLQVIDAPAPVSVFFPSKLVEYIGTGRFLTAISPPGTSTRVVQELGGWVADPSDPEAVLCLWTRILQDRPQELPVAANRYDKENVWAEMAKIIQQTISPAR